MSISVANIHWIIMTQRKGNKWGKIVSKYCQDEKIPFSFNKHHFLSPSREQNYFHLSWFIECNTASFVFIPSVLDNARLFSSRFYSFHSHHPKRNKEQRKDEKKRKNSKRSQNKLRHFKVAESLWTEASRKNAENLRKKTLERKKKKVEWQIFEKRNNARQTEKKDVE